MYAGVLNHMVGRYRKGQKVLPQSLDPNTADQAASASEEPNLDAEFVNHWRRTVLDLAWRALEEWQRQSGQPYYAVLKFRTEHPKVAWAEAAEQLTLQLQPEKPFTEDGIRQTKHRASEKFGEFLVDEVARLVDNPTFEQLEQELIELDLLRYCRHILDRRRPS